MPRSQPRATSMGSRKQAQGKALAPIPQKRLDAYTASLKPQGTPRKRRFFVLRYTDEQNFNWYAQTLEPLTGLPRQWTTAPLAAFTWTEREEAAAMRERTLADWREKMGMMMPMPKYYPHVYHRIDHAHESETITISIPVKAAEASPVPTATRARKRRAEDAESPTRRNSAAEGGRTGRSKAAVRGDGRKRPGKQDRGAVADHRSVGKSKPGKAKPAKPARARKPVPAKTGAKVQARKPVRGASAVGRKPGRTPRR